MKCWVERGGRLHIVCDLDEASEISLALVYRSTQKVIKAPCVEEMADRIGRAVTHMLGMPREAPRMPDPDSPVGEDKRSDLPCK